MVNKEDEASTISISSAERRWLLFLLDALALNSGFLLSLYIRPDYDLTWPLVSDHVEWFLLLNGMWFFVGYLLQIFDLERAGQSRAAQLHVMGAGLLVNFLYNLIPYLPPRLPQSRQPLFIAVFLPAAFLYIGRLFYVLVFAQSRFRRKLLILGAGWAGKTIFETIAVHARTLYKVVGFIDDDPEKIGTQVEILLGDAGQEPDQSLAVEVLGNSRELLQILEERNVATVVLAITKDIGGELYQVLTDCLQREVEIIPMPLLYEQLSGKVPVEHIGDHWSISMPLEQPGTRIAWHALKRAFDLFWASIGLLVLLPFYPLIALAIRFDSRGPILYTQERMGRNGKVFQVYKFRSMVEDAEADGATWAEKNDGRITRVGKILRKTHIDEFPQFWNILKGEMSVVGPRPERPEFIEELEREIPFYRVRLAVKPGMAGWGLIHQGYGASTQDSLDKLQYDLFYIKHQSFWLDMQILWRTVLDAITLRGR